MWKDKVKLIGDYIVKHSKIVFPVIVIAAVAATVSLALSANSADKLEGQSQDTESTEETIIEEATAEVSEIVPVVLNENQDVTALITSYYDAMASGDADTLNTVCVGIPVTRILYYQELAKYIEMYPPVEIYTAAGLDEGSILAFVYSKMVFSAYEDQYPGITTLYLCTNEQGELYIKDRDILSDEELEYRSRVASQDDVVEFYNRVEVEYDELMEAKPELSEYLDEVLAQASAAVGVSLAQENVAETQSTDEAGTEETETTNSEGIEQTPVENPAEPVVQYVTATTTVNVRSSDSVQADSLGKVGGGTKLQVLEQKVNGWTKVLFEGKEGYIKSEYLEPVESADGVAVVGKVTATTNINVRASASENAEKLGVLIGGDSADLLSNENGWCKINYEGQIGYVKSDFVELN